MSNIRTFNKPKGVHLTFGSKFRIFPNQWSSKWSQNFHDFQYSIFWQLRVPMINFVNRNSQFLRIRGAQISVEISHNYYRTSSQIIAIFAISKHNRPIPCGKIFNFFKLPFKDCWQIALNSTTINNTYPTTPPPHCSQTIRHPYQASNPTQILRRHHITYHLQFHTLELLHLRN